MATFSPQQTLAIWDQGVSRHPIDRALLLFSLARPELESNSLADYPVGVRNAALMELQREHFRSRLPAWLECSSCGERLEFEMDSEQLPERNEASDRPLQVEGYSFQLPTSRHLSEVARHCEDIETATRQLLLSCAQQEAELPEDNQALAVLLQRVEAVMEDADPWAHMTVAVQCPSCGQEDLADFDIAEYLWGEIEARSQRLLSDIHMLARNYGWSEEEILALSEQRRAAYLGRVIADYSESSGGLLS